MNALQELLARPNLSDKELRKLEFKDNEKERREHSELRRRKIRTSKIIRDFGQWVVTTYGIECRYRYPYAIEAGRLDEDWLAHMTEKWWVFPDEFKSALDFARKYYQIEQTEFYR